MPITEAEFVRAYPTLFHISLVRDVEQVRRHGLLSTTAILDLCNIEGDSRQRIEQQQRSEPVLVSHAVHGTFLINDQAPMHPEALTRCLIDLTPQEWCRSLNRRVFLWPTRERVVRHLSAQRAAGLARVVLGFDTRRLLNVVDPELIELSPINSGNTLRKAAPRGSVTFKKFIDYPFEERRKSTGLKNAVAEVTVPYAITADQIAALRFSVEVFPGSESKQGSGHD